MEPDTRPPRARRLAHLLLFASLVAVALLAALGYRDMQTMLALTDARKNMRESLLILERSLSLLKDAETGQRGFLLTGEEEFLAPYHAAQEHFAGEYALLADALGTDPVQARRLRELDGLISERFNLLRANIERRRSEGLAPAIAALRTREGKTAMDRIRALFAAIEADRRASIARLDTQVRQVRDRGARLAAGLSGAVLFLVGLAMILLAREHRLRLVAEREAREAAASEARERQERAGRERINRILESITDAFVALDREWRIIYVNATAANIAGQPVARLLGRQLWQDFPEIAARTEFRAACEQAMTAGQTVHRVGYLPAWKRWFESHIYPGPGGIVIYFRDITEAKRAEEDLAASRDQLRLFAQRENERMEAEHARIAREIHDQLGQIFTSVKLILGQLRPRPGEVPADAGGLLDEAAALMDEGVDVARRIAAELRPALLDDLGLGAALRAYAERFSRQSGVACEVDVNQDHRLASAQAIQLYRIALEALTNVTRHAHARGVRIAGRPLGADYVLDIEDDGIGWLGPPPDDSIGLTGMRERARLAGGSLEYGASPGGGTFLRARLPLATDKGGPCEF